MFTNFFKKRIHGIPLDNSAVAKFAPRKPPQQLAKIFWREDELPNDIDAMLQNGVIKNWRPEQATGFRWFTAEDGAVEWWKEIND